MNEKLIRELRTEAGAGRTEIAKSPGSEAAVLFLPIVEPLERAADALEGRNDFELQFARRLRALADARDQKRRARGP